MKITAYNADYPYLLTSGGAFAVAGGDLGGSFPGPIVTGIEGIPIDASTLPPTTGWVLTAISPTSIGFAAASAWALTIKDEGTPLATAATSIDFVGAGVTASGAGAAKTITIPGGVGRTFTFFGG